MSVRVNLRLNETAKAENVLRVCRYDTRGRLLSAVPVAYATGVVMKNVQPVVHELVRQRVAAGRIHKTPCAWLEGELVSWSGRFRKKADPDMVKLLSESRMSNVFRSRASRKVLEQGKALGFNPKKCTKFYQIPATGKDIGNIFSYAVTVAVCHWSYKAHGAFFFPIQPGEIVAKAAPPSSVERQDLPKGILTTRKRLESLGLSLK